MQYWIGRNGQKLGPYTIEDLRGMAANGGAVASDLVWADGMPNWAPLFSVIPQAPPAAAPPPPPAPAAAPPPPAWQQPQPQQQQPQYQPPQAQQQPQPAQQYSYPQQQQPQQQAPYQQAPQYQMAAPMGMPMGVPANAGHMPPDMHWALVLVIGMFTLGIFSIYWLFKQANFVKQIDPTSKALPLAMASIGLRVIYVVIYIGMFVLLRLTDSYALMAAVSGLSSILSLASVVCMILAAFQMRTSLQNYYNSVEPIGLKLSGVMTFFFSVLYFQHHFSRIAKWKTTGVLDPQG